MEKNVKIKENIKKCLYIVFLGLITLLLVSSMFSKFEFSDESFEEYIFYSLNGIGSSDFSMVIYAVKKYILIYLAILFILIALTNKITKKEYKYYPVKIITNHKIIFAVIVTIVFSVISLNNVDFFGYVSNNINTTKIFDKEYNKINYEDVIFNEKKNLITIYVESLETTFFSKEHGGNWDYEILSELNDLMDDNAIYFATDSNRRGIYNLYGTSWTTASIISSTSGVPFKIPFENSKFTKDNFLRKIITLGDVLKYQGYHNEVISGASTKFGSLYDYFKIHGDYEIIEPDNIDKYKIDVNYDTNGRWGFNDKYMFDLAKDRLTKLAKSNIPFNETLIGIDSHPIDGYKASFTVDKFHKQYENVYATESILLSEFINWIKEQDFYKDTVIVIIGDHLCMQTSFMKDHSKEDRGRFNLFINSFNNTENTKNRGVASYDLYPTILSSMGASIKNDKIGLGVNLFSNNKTLIEKYGIEKLEKELKRKSLYYNYLLKK